MLNMITVSAALNTAFEDLCARNPDDVYLSVSATWTNPAGKLISMHISLADGLDVDEGPDSL